MTKFVELVKVLPPSSVLEFISWLMQRKRLRALVDRLQTSNLEGLARPLGSQSSFSPDVVGPQTVAAKPHPQRLRIFYGQMGDAALLARSIEASAAAVYSLLCFCL